MCIVLHFGWMAWKQAYLKERGKDRKWLLTSSQRRQSYQGEEETDDTMKKTMQHCHNTYHKCQPDWTCWDHTNYKARGRNIYNREDISEPVSAQCKPMAVYLHGENRRGVGGYGAGGRGGGGGRGSCTYTVTRSAYPLTTTRMIDIKAAVIISSLLLQPLLGSQSPRTFAATLVHVFHVRKTCVDRPALF